MRTSAIGLLWLFVAQGSEAIFPRQDWYRLELFGVHVGWMSLEAERSAWGGRSAICVRTELILSLLRSGTSIELRRVRSVFFSDVFPFESYAFQMTTNESGSPRFVEGQVVEGTLHMTTRLDGRTSTETFPFPLGTLFEEAVPYFLTERKLSKGESVEIFLFHSDLLRSLRDTVTFEGTSPRGERLFRHRLDWMGGVEMDDWLDENGNVLRTELKTLGVPMALVRVPSQEAIPPRCVEMDVLLKTRLVPEGGVPLDPERFRAWLWIEQDSFLFPTTSRQTLQPVGAGGYLLEVRRDPIPSGTVSFPVGDSKWDPFLQPTVYVECDDPQIRATAADIVTGASNAWEAARRINAWVYRAISDKNLRIGLGSARQTLVSRAGDCTEHTVLAVALCRAAGIPARILSGLVWHGDGFYHHFWFEAFVGEWVAFDPTFGQAPADARRIQFNVGALESNTVLELGEGVLRTLNRLRIVLLDEKKSESP